MRTTTEVIVAIFAASSIIAGITLLFIRREQLRRKRSYQKKIRKLEDKDGKNI